jgi:hypothetical protein
MYLAYLIIDPPSHAEIDAADGLRFEPHPGGMCALLVPCRLPATLM